MERLRVQVIENIIYCLRAGQSERSIAKDLNHVRGAIRRYHDWAKEKSHLDSDLPLPALPDIVVELGPLQMSERATYPQWSYTEGW